jgi:hypothetical protein
LVLVVTALQTLDDDVHESFFADLFVDPHLVHDLHPDDRPDLLDCCDQAPYHDHQLVLLVDRLHLGLDPARHDLVLCDRPNLPDHVPVAMQEFDRCVHLSMAKSCVAADDY